MHICISKRRIGFHIGWLADAHRGAVQVTNRSELPPTTNKGMAIRIMLFGTWIAIYSYMGEHTSGIWCKGVVMLASVNPFDWISPFWQGYPLLVVGVSDLSFGVILLHCGMALAFGCRMRYSRLIMPKENDIRVFCCVTWCSQMSLCKLQATPSKEKWQTRHYKVPCQRSLYLPHFCHFISE